MVPTVERGDLLVVFCSMAITGDRPSILSTSGRSRNILHALKAAKEKGLITIGMAGNNGGMLSSLIDYPLFVQEKHTPYVQEIHLTCKATANSTDRLRV